MTNGNEVRHVVGGSRKRYRASGQRYENPDRSNDQ